MGWSVHQLSPILTIRQALQYCLIRPTQISHSKKSGHLSFSHSLRVGSSAPPAREVALVYCPRKVQGPLFSCVQQLVRGRASSSTLVTLGPAAGNKEHGGRAPFLHLCQHMADGVVSVRPSDFNNMVPLTFCGSMGHRHQHRIQQLQDH